ncbi:MAG: hypothetical protein R3190_05485 [Thermoanaerobaculia bacterium]|nr:hypothetical protein [Thermoanaerobaculia bacterium]
MTEAADCRAAIRLLVCMCLLFTALPGAAEEYRAPRTPWGHPDLQGLYVNTTLTPFERPEALGDKAFLTAEEAAALEKQRAEMISGAADSGPQRTEAGGRVGAYNLHWLELGTRVVGDRRTSLVVDPPDGRVPVRPEAEAERDRRFTEMFEDYVHMSVWDRCITRGVPGGFFPAGYNNSYRIFQTPEYVAIYFEMIHNVRVIPLDGRDHVASDIRLWNGDSRGRWEGDTLVVETRNFTDKGWIATSGSQGRIKGIPQTADALVVERFTRVDEGTIDYRVTVEDPAVYTAPWTAAVPLYTEPGYEMFEYACHEGNWAVRNTLSGARAQEGSPPSGGQ